MPRKIQNTSKAHLVSIPLPNHAASYTVISHQFVIDYAYQALANAGFGIVDEEYRCTADGQIAQGVYKLNFNNDPELSMMFAWTNSYNKQVKFKCVVGAYINNTGAVMISGDIGSWVRKHTGSADTETKATIDDYITNAHMYYTQLCSDKAVMETITLNKRKQSQLLGVLFAEYEILTTEQASMVRDQMKKPYHVFSNTDSLWAFYNYVTNSLQYSHPKTWMEDQRILHYFIGTICDFSQQVPVTQPVAVLSEPVEEEVVADPLHAIPNQTNILDQIAELAADKEADMIDEDIKYAAIEEEDELVEASEEIEIHIESDQEYLERVAEIEGEPEAETKMPQEIYDALMTAPEIDASEVDMSKVTWVNAPDIVQYTDPAGNTFETLDFDNVVNEEPEVEIVEETKEDDFAIEDNFDLDFTDKTEEDGDSISDFF